MILKNFKSAFLLRMQLIELIYKIHSEFKKIKKNSLYSRNHYEIGSEVLSNWAIKQKLCVFFEYKYWYWQPAEWNNIELHKYSRSITND